MLDREVIRRAIACTVLLTVKKGWHIFDYLFYIAADTPGLCSSSGPILRLNVGASSATVRKGSRFDKAWVPASRYNFIFCFFPLAVPPDVCFCFFHACIHAYGYLLFHPFLRAWLRTFSCPTTFWQFHVSFRFVSFFEFLFSTALHRSAGRTAVMIDGGRYHSCAVLDNAALKVRKEKSTLPIICIWRAQAVRWGDREGGRRGGGGGVYS